MSNEQTNKTLPNGWQSFLLKDISTVVTGKTPSTKDNSFWNGEIPFITPVELEDSTIVKTNRYITEKGLVFCKSLPKETVLVSCIGYIGKVGITQIEKSVTNQQINAVIPKQGFSDSWFLLYFFRSYKDKLRDLAAATTIPILNKSNFEQVLIPLPPLPEQKAIAKILRSVQESKEARQTELRLERERKNALMDYLFTHGTRGESLKQTEIGDMPESWRVIKFSEVCNSSAFGPRFSGDLYDSQGNVATLRTTDLDIDGNINYSTMPIARIEFDKFKEHFLQAQDFLITRSGTCGIAAVFESFEKPVLAGAFLIRFRLNQKLSPYFFRLYCNSPLGKLRVSQLASGAIQKNISGTSMLNFKILLPSIDEQKEIAEVLQACDEKILALEKEINLLDEFFKAMLEELMSGKLSSKNVIE